MGEKDFNYGAYTRGVGVSRPSAPTRADLQNVQAHDSDLRGCPRT
jgi:hypothetical protein